MEEKSRATRSSALAPSVVTSLRAGAMERSISEDIREEREELREAAEQTLNVIMDLNLDGTVRWVSPSWVDVIGTVPASVEGKSIADLIVSDNAAIFSEAAENMKKDDSHSQFIRFAVKLGPLSRLLLLEVVKMPEESEQPAIVDLEAQGIMVYDSASGSETHTMWMMRPWMAPREIKIDLPAVIVESLGSGAEVLASYLTQLAELGIEDQSQHPQPPDLLCRICERHISPWWFEKHTDLCLQEHRAEMDVQMSQESLSEHRHAIVRVLDALEVRKSSPLGCDRSSLPVAEYKGIAIGPTSTTPSPGTSSPTTGFGPSVRPLERTGGFGHGRARSFAVRRPQTRIVELLIDLCDTAMEISVPAIKETSQNPGEFRAQSPQSEGRIMQVMQWETPSTNTLEQEQGLALLVADTEQLAKGKVDAVIRYRRIIEYAERIRIEFAVMVQDCISEAVRKTQKIAAGRLSDSTEDEEDTAMQEEAQAAEGELVVPLPTTESGREQGLFLAPFDEPSSLALALEKANISDDVDKRRLSSTIHSARSSSPNECPTPRSHRGALSSFGGGCGRESRRESLMLESDAGDSDGSMRSASTASRPPQRAGSPISEFGDLRRQASSRQHQRRSLILPGTVSLRRQESPSRPAQPSSPLRVLKPRGFPLPPDGFMSPESSPRLPAGEFTSPIISHHYYPHHHRRQSSAAVSSCTGELGTKPPPSPRLGSVTSVPQARAVPPSIKDFEIIKPISKGAFGSVYLSKKKSTGEYFAIKVLKKADMIAKNQVTNVKAERAIMMWQGESDFVAKLYWTFSSKDYLYLVMEYLNGGDCASLIKVLGGLPENWAKKYLAEVVLGVEHLHSRGIVHRDLKPDNLLIDQKGHLKLTDFGLSRMGLVGRQKRALNSGADAAPDILKQGPFARSTSMASSRSTSMDLQGRAPSPAPTPQVTPTDSGPNVPPSSYFNLATGGYHEARRVCSQRSDSGGSEALSQMLGNFSLNERPVSVSPQVVQLPPPENDEGAPSPESLCLHHTNTQSSSDTGRGTPPQASLHPPNWALFDPDDTSRRFVGTPDYLAPETIRGEPQDETSDWWSVGCIMYEFLYGIPPFHAGEAEQVFENILNRRLNWPDDSENEVSSIAKDLINKLLCTDRAQRFGANKDENFQSGGEEIRSHPWFSDIKWDTLLQDDAQFVPQPENPEDTEYFDARGATLQTFAEEIEDQASPPTSVPPSEYGSRPHDAVSGVRSHMHTAKRGLIPLHIPPHIRETKPRRLSEPFGVDDFGNFTFKNLPVLDKANKDTIQKLRAEALSAHPKPSVISPGGISTVSSPGPPPEGSPVMPNHPVQRTLSNAKALQRPQSPSGISHANSSPSRVPQPPTPLLVSFVAGQGNEVRRKASSNSSSLSHQSAASLQPGTMHEVSRVPPTLQKAATTGAASSPVKGKGMPPPPPLALSPQKLTATPRQASASGGRSRSLTVGSQEGSPIAADIFAGHHKNRRSQVFDMSPSSSDNEGEKAQALLRVQRRRQSSRRVSHIMLDAPMFRPLDVLVCEDHPVSRMVMEKLLEKLRCRTISAATGAEAVRYSMSDIKFDIIFMEFKLPQINGADVARMIRETKNANSHTPLVAITAYLKELQAPHYFDSLIEKPISSSKLTEVLGNLCHWKPASPSQSQSLALAPQSAYPVPSSLREESRRLEDSPTSGSSTFAHRSSSSFRDDSITGSSLFGDSESVSTDEIPVVISRKGTADWDEGVLEIIGPDDILMNPSDSTKLARPSKEQPATAKIEQRPSPKTPLRKRSVEKLQARRESIEKRRLEGSVDSADDEDEELGHGPTADDSSTVSSSNTPLGSTKRQHYRSKSVLPSSKLGIEMMRANSHDSVTNAGSESTSTEGTAVQGPASPDRVLQLREQPKHTAASEPSTPPSVFEEEGDETVIISSPPMEVDLAAEDAEETPRPGPTLGRTVAEDEDPTPRPRRSVDWELPAFVTLPKD